MTINALNSGAKVFMADFEDALSPTWANVIGGQAAMQDAVWRSAATIAINELTKLQNSRHPQPGEMSAG